MAETKYQIHDEKCAKLLSHQDIRFAGIIDSDGNLVAGGQRAGLAPLEENESKLQSFMEFISKTSTRKEYDADLGPINYIAARRDKAVLISFPFPVSDILLLISAEPNVDIENLAKQVVDIFTGVQ